MGSVYCPCQHAKQKWIKEDTWATVIVTVHNLDSEARISGPEAIHSLDWPVSSSPLNLLKPTFREVVLRQSTHLSYLLRSFLFAPRSF